MNWPKHFSRFAYLLFVIGAIGIVVSFVEGIHATYYKIYVDGHPNFKLPADRTPTEEEKQAYREEARRIKWEPYSRARSIADIGLLVGFGATIFGIIIAIYAGKWANRMMRNQKAQ